MLDRQRERLSGQRQRLESRIATLRRQRGELLSKHPRTRSEQVEIDGALKGLFKRIAEAKRELYELRPE